MKNDDWRSYADGSATPIDARQSVNQQSAVANRQRDVADFARDVARDLALTPKQLQSKYLYDALGSSLFEAICRLPWYRITRAEQQLLERHAPEVRSEEHTSELQSRGHLVCRLLLEKKKTP